jgi:capsular exopolysaccharide synthesis family protein
VVNPDEGGSELELRDYLRVLRRRKWVVVLAILVAVGASIGLSQLQTPRYAGTAELLLQARTTESLFNPVTGQRADPTRAVQTEIRVLESQPVRDLVRSRLGKAPRVSGRPIGQTDVIEVRVESADARLAADAANAYARGYIDFRREQAVNDLFEASRSIEERVAQLQAQIAAAPEAQRPSLERLQSFFREELDKLQVQSELKTGGAQVVREAAIADSPFSPKPVRNGILAFVLGGILGIGLAFFFEYLDDSVKDKDELERATALPVLGLIPAVTAWKAKEQPRIVSISEPASPAAEAYRTLRTAVQFISLDKPVRAIQITSPSAQEGKTTTLSNLGVALARAGHEVVIICCDLRRPRVHEFFGLANSVGFTSVLLGEAPLSAALQRVPGVDRLSVLASGPLPPNPSELLSSRRAGEVLAPLKAEGRIVLVDSPPILPVTDALVLSRWVDATLMVCSAAETSRKEAARAVELLRQVEAPLVGTILNGVKPDEGYGYGYYYRQRTYESLPSNGRATASGNGDSDTASDGKRRGRRKARRK